jgi:hypothetical protein
LAYTLGAVLQAATDGGESGLSADKFSALMSERFITPGQLVRGPLAQPPGQLVRGPLAQPPGQLVRGPPLSTSLFRRFRHYLDVAVVTVANIVGNTTGVGRV